MGFGSLNVALHILAGEAERAAAQVRGTPEVWPGLRTLGFDPKALADDLKAGAVRAYDRVTASRRGLIRLRVAESDGRDAAEALDRWFRVARAKRGVLARGADPARAGLGRDLQPLLAWRNPTLRGMRAAARDVLAALGDANHPIRALEDWAADLDQLARLLDEADAVDRTIREAQARRRTLAREHEAEVDALRALLGQTRDAWAASIELGASAAPLVFGLVRQRTVPRPPADPPSVSADAREAPTGAGDGDAAPTPEGAG